jgi:protein-tyrosine phosphatase
MFSIFKKKAPVFDSNYFPIVTDIHSHILPGIDDGSPDVDNSIELIEGLMKLGVTSSIATPHIIGDMFRNNEETISKALSILRNKLVEKNIHFPVNAAAEYMMDDYFLELLKNKTKLLTLKENIILTEFSYSEKPYNHKQMVFSIITEGYQPILAHPERYGYFHHDYKIYDELKDLGFMLQVNLLSLTGYYGKEVAKAANYIVKNNLVSFTATDMHHARHLQALSLPQHKAIFAQVYSNKLYNEEMVF